MKRHSLLSPLSRQHHGGLILSQLLKRDAPGYKLLPADTEGKILYAIRFYNSDLLPHFEIEEKVFETLTGIDNSLDKIMKELVEDHVELRKYFTHIVGLEDAVSYLDTIGHLLEKHIRKEDRELFPMIESLVDKTRMDTIAQLLNH